MSSRDHSQEVLWWVAQWLPCNLRVRLDSEVSLLISTSTLFIQYRQSRNRGPGTLLASGVHRDERLLEPVASL